ncbi:hypothetical protein pEaSNUABM56_00266 [Erwinia phage pEa_SNUABM_56]|nr:hypothetical protein pEaSNUABM56_00266 [Erwinia phage pEa_SNUABM_56]
MSRFMATGKFPEGTKFFRLEKKNMWRYECPICEKDEYALAGVGGEDFISRVGELLKGDRSCRCKYTYRFNFEQYLFKVKKTLLEEGLDFISLEKIREPFKQHNVIVTYKCSCGKVLSPRLSNFMFGQRCKMCKSKSAGQSLMTAHAPEAEKRSAEKAKLLGCEFVGFDTGEWLGHEKTRVVFRCPEHGDWDFHPAQLKKRCGCPVCGSQSQRQSYINLIMDEGLAVALKFGIATHSSNRLQQQNSKNLFQMSVLGVWSYPETTSCRRAERECKRTLQCRVLTSREIKDGHTETVSVLDLEKIIAIYEKHGGVRIR